MKINLKIFNLKIVKITEKFLIMLIKSKLKEINQINAKKINFIENIEF